MTERGWCYIGIDESNHGRHPEIFVAALSRRQDSAIIYPKIRFRKERKHSRLKERLDCQDYRFTLVTEGQKRLPDIVSTLLEPEIHLDSKGINIYLDGLIQEEECLEIKRRISDETGVSYVEIYSGSKFDQRVGIVNLADEIANWLYRESLINLSDNKRLRRIKSISK